MKNHEFHHGKHNTRQFGDQNPARSCLGHRPLAHPIRTRTPLFRWRDRPEPSYRPTIAWRTDVSFHPRIKVGFGARVAPESTTIRG
jgi:hypothetical protein